MTLVRPEVGIVIVTHRSRDPLQVLLASLRDHEPGTRVVVVDSGSPEGPPSVPSETKLIPLDENVGYGAACNIGTGGLDAVDVYVFLNPDVRLTGPSITELTEEIVRRPRLGVATGPVVDPSGKRVAAAWGPTSTARAFWFATAWRLPRLRRFIGRWITGGLSTSGASSSREEMFVDGHVLGGTMIVRRTCFEQLDGFDEDFFLYWEDADLCQRAREAGWDIGVLPCTPFVHHAGTSSEGVRSEQRWGWYLEGAQRFARKHLSGYERRRLMTALRMGRMLRRYG